ncbi:MAG: lipopolysaccharide biosynthesis protein [Actinomycetales bacterium]|nr:lipopolysaccharide biosynthesis protein [Actinomycetales bacterium]
MTALAQRAARGTAATLLAQLARFVLQFGSVLVLARLLVPADFGIVAMVTAVIGIAEIFRDFGLSAAAIQAPELSREQRTNLFWANSVLGVACAFAAVALTPALVALYDEPRLGSVVPALAGVFVLSGLNSQYRASLTRDMRFGALAASDVIAQAVGAAVAIGLAWAGAGLWALVAQQLVVALTSLTVNAGNARWLPGRPVRGAPIRGFMRYGSGFLGAQSLMYATSNIDAVVVGAAWGKVEIGLYSRAYQLLMVPLNQINAPLTRVALPVLSRIQEDTARLARYVGRAQLVVCYVTTLVLAVAAALAEPLVHVLFGPGWEGVAPIFAILAIGGIFRAAASVAYWTYLARALTGAMFRLQLWTRPLMVAVIVAGTPWGGRGVATGVAIAYAGYWVASLVDVGRRTGIPVAPYFGKAIFALLAVAAPAASAAWGASLAVEGAPVRVLLGLAAAAGALGLLWLAVPAVRRDLAVLADFARQASRRAR